MNSVAGLFKSSLGRKYLMAASGFLLFLFVIAHLLGNLQMFLGPETINRYGHFLQSNPELIWPARIGLVALVAIHIWAAIQLSIENKKARPIAYAGSPAPPSASYASRTMLMSGLIIAAFIIYHLLHFTVQNSSINLVSDPVLKQFKQLQDPQGRHDIYRMMIIGFSNPFVSAFYIIGIALLCLHLSHGVYAMFQSLGIKVGFWPGLPKFLARWAAILIFLGYISIPVTVLLGGFDCGCGDKVIVPVSVGKEAK